MCKIERIWITRSLKIFKFWQKNNTKKRIKSCLTLNSQCLLYVQYQDDIFPFYCTNNIRECWTVILLAPPQTAYLFRLYAYTWRGCGNIMYIPLFKINFTSSLRQNVCCQLKEYVNDRCCPCCVVARRIYQRNNKNFWSQY